MKRMLGVAAVMSLSACIVVPARTVYRPAPVYYGPAPVYYAPAPVYPYYPYYGGYGGYNRPSVTGSIIFSFPFHF